MFWQVEYHTTLEHVTLVAENVCNPNSYTKSECSRCSFMLHPKMFILPTEVASYFSAPLPFNRFFSPIHSLSSVSVFFLPPAISYCPLIFCVQGSHSLYFLLFSSTCISLLSSEPRECLGKNFPLNFISLPLPCQ